MCTYSMAMDWKIDEWRDRFPVLPIPLNDPDYIFRPITQEEIDEFRRLLDRARKYDADNGEPECELDEKKEQLKKFADQLGVKIKFV